ncbi:BppU family phage baseplate upper protein [Enterococcus sp. BWM-S5]|uniref:BppU family phage baseplate upper protein n=1 Tax=Enterococcus larvae TaxID=2794352 RepID=A0ABS4CEK1_9ENTE|nr:BppU family phage baseplate upper protein [Enterococcus larvae]MBP1044839.1 BppU family phage baseplate upper protein [Enterococcus larvae]
MKIFNLDISKESSINPVVFGRIGDKDLQIIKINLSNNFEQFDLTDCEVKFEAVTAADTKVMDAAGISVVDAGIGEFNYTFPSQAFSASGKYKRAYFSITKGDKRDTTENIDIFVYNNADITGDEAETVISEYDKLVSELNEAYTAAIAVVKEQSDAFDDYREEITGKVNEIQTFVNENLAILETAIADIEEKINSLDIYTKQEIDTIMNLKADKENSYTKMEVDAKLSNKADTARAQLDKLTADDGRPIATIQSGTILSAVLSRAPGMKTYTFTNATSDYPTSASTSMRGYAYMASVSYGYVFAADIGGGVFVRTIVNSVWVGAWTKLTGTEKIVNVFQSASLTGEMTIEGEKIRIEYTIPDTNQKGFMEMNPQAIVGTIYDSTDNIISMFSLDYTGLLLRQGDKSALLSVNDLSLYTTTLTIGYNINAVLTRFGKMVTLSITRISRNWSDVGENVLLTASLPAGYRPLTPETVTINKNNSTNISTPVLIHVNTDGTMRYTNSASGQFICSASATWFTNDPYPT